MPRTIHRPSKASGNNRRVVPSVVDPSQARPFTLDQELQPFGAWVGSPILVPPKDASKVMAQTMLQETRPFASKARRWQAVEKKHRADFTQVREFELFDASIRLPKGRLFVTVTQQKDFDKITDPIPACVQTRLDEFLSGVGKKRGAKVYYLKPLCVETGDDLIFTTRDDLFAAIEKVQDEVFADYRRLALRRRPLEALTAVANVCLALPRGLVNFAIARKQKAIEELHAHLEFKRRKLALSAAKTHRKLRTDGCTFDEMLDLTNPLKRADVIEQYCVEQELSQAKRAQLFQLAAGTIPWFLALSVTLSFLSTAMVATSVAPVAVCDPAFVAEMPGSRGVLLKIGHFDQVGGITHIEI